MSDLLRQWIDDACSRLKQGVNTLPDQLTIRESGRVTTVSTGIAKINGLPGVGAEERVEFPHGLEGIAFNVDADEVGVVLLGRLSVPAHR